MDQTSAQHSGNGNDLAARAEEKVREISQAARTRAQERARQLRQKARERAAGYSGMAYATLEDRREQVASRIDKAASELRQRADAGGSIGHEAGVLATKPLAVTAGYLHQHETRDIVNDFARYIREHPIRSIIAAGIFGYLIGRALS